MIIYLFICICCLNLLNFSYCWCFGRLADSRRRWVLQKCSWPVVSFERIDLVMRRLPVFQGPSFTFISPLIALGTDPTWTCSSAAAENTSECMICAIKRKINKVVEALGPPPPPHTHTYEDIRIHARAHARTHARTHQLFHCKKWKGSFL